MKKTITILLLFLCGITYAQNIRFNKKLNAFCERSLADTSAITPERKKALYQVAVALTNKKAIVFTCKTNTRRTQLLQTWMQTAFYYFGITGKMSFSVGDTLAEIHPSIISVLKKSGFVLSESKTKPPAYIFYVGARANTHAIYPKKTLKSTSPEQTVMVNICMENEPQSSVGANAFLLPYESPKKYDNTPENDEKYTTLNNKIATEMLYLAGLLSALNIEDYR